MLSAILMVHRSHQFWITPGGYKYCLVLLGVAAVLSLVSSGTALLGTAVLHPLSFAKGLLAVLVGIGTAWLSTYQAPRETLPQTPQRA